MPSTTASWARPIQSFEEIPNAFKEFLPQSELFPYIIYSPTDSWGEKQTNAKLTCMYRDKIVVLEVIKGKVNTVCYWFNDIDYIEHGTMLLYSWIGIHGFVDGKLSNSIVEYNSVVTPYFHPIVKAIRQIHPISETIGDNQDLSKLDYLNILNYKFFNYSHESILTGEEIVRTVYQPAVYEKFMLFLTRIVTLSHLTILTNKELIIIKEEELIEVKRKSNVKNGGVWVYIPLHKILNITIDSNKRINLLTLVISVKQNTIKLTFSSPKRRDLEAFIAEFRVISKLND
jgi:hypothetical protein